jgi:hypothetical protein
MPLLWHLPELPGLRHRCAGKSGRGSKMTRTDLFWCLGGLVLGLLIAGTTLMEQGFAVNSFNAGRLTGNVLGGVLVMWGIGRLVRWINRKA